MRFLAALLLCLFAVSPAFSQKTKSVLTSEINSNFPDNAIGSITPQILRNVTTDMVNSWQQYAGVNPQAGTSYTIQLSDYGQLVNLSNAGSVAVSIPQASGAFSTYNTTISYTGLASATITPSGGSLINGAASFSLSQNQSVWLISDGTNWQTVVGASTFIHAGPSTPVAGVSQAIDATFGTTAAVTAMVADADNWPGLSVRSGYGFSKIFNSADAAGSPGNTIFAYAEAHNANQNVTPYQSDCVIFITNGACWGGVDEVRDDAAVVGGKYVGREIDLNICPWCAPSSNSIALPINIQGSNLNGPGIFMNGLLGSVPIVSGTYNSGTGAVSLTLAQNSGVPVGQKISVTATGTGSVASINGTATATSGTTGTTLNFTTGTGLTLTITGGTIFTPGGVTNAIIFGGNLVVSGSLIAAPSETLGSVANYAFDFSNINPGKGGGIFANSSPLFFANTGNSGTGAQLFNSSGNNTVLSAGSGGIVAIQNNALSASFANFSSSGAQIFGPLTLTGSSSGGANIQCPAACGTPVLTVPTTTGTLINTAGGQSIAGLAVTSSFTAGGNAGLSVTKTVRASGGASDCTLIYTLGVLTGGSC